MMLNKFQGREITKPMHAIKKFFSLAIFMCFFPHPLLASDGAISPREANEKYVRGEVIIVDVREASEIRETGMAKPAEWLATSEINARGPAYKDALSRWPKSKPLVVYCRSGNRSAKALRAFQELGYTGFNMGAFQGWSDAGLPTKSAP